MLVEILETTLIERTGDQIISILSELSDAGFGVAIDNFVTGFSGSDGMDVPRLPLTWHTGIVLS